VIQLGGIKRDGVLDFLEQVFVIDDVAESFLAVSTVDTAELPGQAVVLHGLVDVQISEGGASNPLAACQHHKELHVSGFLYEQRLGPLLVCLGFVMPGLASISFSNSL